MTTRASVLLAAAFAASLGVAAAAATNPSIANGRAIFQTGRDLKGVPIHTTGRRPLAASCAACHRANGSGGVHIGGAVSADLRHAALAHMKHPYTLALLERAISKGIDSDGQQLSPVMPRWQMSSTDLHDVADYVLTQLK